MTIESGQAHVYRASHPNFQFQCALKRLKNTKRSERFSREVRVMESLALAGVPVPEIVDSDLQAAKPWYAMRWFDDGSMDSCLTGEAGGTELLRDIRRLKTLASAVADVHALNVAHRDLKPANVLLDGERLVLTDFGLCLEIDDDYRLTETDEGVGSRFYIAPENEAGIHEELDQRPADFYAFGKICWSVLLHRQPLARELAIEKENSLVRLLGDGRLAPLDSLIRDLLARDPRARLREWEVVLRELDAVDDALTGVATTPSRSARSEVVAAARRLRDLPQVADADKRQKERDRIDIWTAFLQREMLSAARRIEMAVADLHEALDGILTITATAGGAAEPQSFAHLLPALPPVALLNSHSSDAGVVLLVHSQQGIDAFPTLNVRIAAFVDDSSNLYIVSVPNLTRHGERESVAEALASSLAHCEGPHPLLRQATVDAARKFTAEIADMFVAAIEHYIVVLTAGADPGDEASWRDVELNPNGSAQAGPAVGDVTAPDLRSFELLPGHAHPGTTGATVVCRVRLVDAGAGVAGTGYTGSPSQARVRSPNGQTLDVVFTDRCITSGDAHDGTYEERFSFTPGAERGRWEVEYMMTVDGVGNTRNYSTSELRSLGFPTVINVAK